MKKCSIKQRGHTDWMKDGCANATGGIDQFLVALHIGARQVLLTGVRLHSLRLVHDATHEANGIDSHTTIGIGG
jgi:hypothetical protein